MRNRHSLVIGVCIVLGCLALGLLMGQPSTGQAAPALPAEGRPGTYQVFAVANDLGSVSKIIVCNTATGQMWWSEKVGGDWYELPSPVNEKKK